MKHHARSLISGAISIALLSTSTFVRADDQTDQDKAGTATSAEGLEELVVVAQRARRVSSGATNLDLEIKETPQSISLVTIDQMQDFGAKNLNDALKLATGVQVADWETNRSIYLSRGFEIKNTQIDGVGMPNGWGITTGDVDTYGYDKIEVIRGANGLLTGVGNSSGTLNYVRKRPTNTAQGQIGGSVGSWNEWRVDADYSTPFTKDGSWAGRIVAVHDEGDSYLRDFQKDRTFLYGVVDGQVGANGTLTVGYSWQEANTNNNMWGALSFSGSDGSQLEWPRSSSTSQDWTYWNTNTDTGFVDYTLKLSDRWQLKTSYNYRRIWNDDKLFFGYAPVGVDPVTKLGLYGWAYKAWDETTAHLGDVSVNGKFSLFGREHEAMLGVSYAKSERTDQYNPIPFTDPAFGPLPAFPFGGDVVAEPDWGAPTPDTTTTLNQTLKRAFGVTRLALTDRFKAIVGFNYAEYHRDGRSPAPFDQTEDNVSPYAGLTFAFTDSVLAYANYSYIFQPQDQYDHNHNYLDPTKGVNYELGVKAEWMDHHLLTTLAWFDAKQEGLGTYAGYEPIGAFYYYKGVDVESKGWEFEATGRLGDNVDLVLGYTQLNLTGEDGSDIYKWVPRHSANMMLSAHLPSYTALSFGVSGRYQSEIENADGYTGRPVRQDSYALLNAFAAWDIQQHVTLRANVENLTDEKYINSLYVVGYYAAPVSYSLSLDWRF
jgi:outer membrane receptor for ferric coprogen and ferric-rhodotorulic acid